MKRLGWTGLLCAMLAGSLSAADADLSRAQTALRQQGYYYGEIDGVFGDETEHAIRRFQIRNGLKVTGKLDAETKKALSAGGQSNDEPQLPPDDTSDLRAPENAVPKKTIEEDKAFLNGGNTKTQQKPGKTKTLPVQPAPGFYNPRKPKPQPQQAPYIPPRTSPGGVYRAQPMPYLDMFLDSPFEGASNSEQRRVLMMAQEYLRRYGYYEGPIDGVPGPATEIALKEYQRAARLRKTGRLDGSTLELMGLAPAGPNRPDRYVRERSRRYYYYEDDYYYAPSYYGPPPGAYYGGYWGVRPSISFGWSVY